MSHDPPSERLKYAPGRISLSHEHRELQIAKGRYEDALFSGGAGTERRIADAVMGLESLWLRDDEKEVLGYRLRHRVEAIAEQWRQNLRIRIGQESVQSRSRALPTWFIADPGDLQAVSGCDPDKPCSGIRPNRSIPPDGEPGGQSHPKYSADFENPVDTKPTNFGQK